jgi:hypothetical protein
MEISGKQATELTQLLKECTADVMSGGVSRGAAFFVSNTILLTSYHVVEERADLTIQTRRGRTPSVAVIAPNPGRDDDLALLRVAIEDSDPGQPAVLLDDSIEAKDYYVVGYPDEQGQGPGQEGFYVEGHDRAVIHGTPVLLQVEAGKIVTYGMSGGPVLNMDTGAVAAVIRSSKNPNEALGGGAIPVARVFQHYPELAEFGRNAPVAVERWRNVLGPELWRLRGQAWEIATEIDLTIGGTRNAWSIASKVISEEGVTRTASDLGEDLTEAMFRWAQRRRLSTRDEVELLGRLLEKALFPAPVEHHLRALSEADHLTLRLHVDPSCGLDDIPWELACVPDSSEFLSAHPTYRLVRVDDRVDPADPSPTPEEIRVLSFSGLAPERWQYPAASFGDERDGPPTVERIAGNLAESLAGPAFSHTDLGEQTEELQELLGAQSYDVLHYIGVGKLSADGQRGELSLVDEFGAPWFLDMQELLKWARQAGVRLVVLQFTGPPIGERFESVSLSSLGELVGGGIEAVVMTRFPVHPRQFAVFNRWLYQYLGQGRTLEDAVQQGRVKLKQAPVVDDWAGFGFFTLITDGSAEIRLAPTRIEQPQQPVRPRHATEAAGAEARGQRAGRPSQRPGFVRGQ